MEWSTGWNKPKSKWGNHWRNIFFLLSALIARRKIQRLLEIGLKITMVSFSSLPVRSIGLLIVRTFSRLSWTRKSQTKERLGKDLRKRNLSSWVSWPSKSGKLPKWWLDSNLLLSLQLKSMREISQIFSQRHASPSTLSNGRNNWDSRPSCKENQLTAMLSKPTQVSLMDSSTKATTEDWLWLPWLIDATWLLPQLCISRKVAPLKVPLVLVKQKQSKISVKALQNSCWCLTVLKVLITRVWEGCFQVWCKQEAGVASISSTESS